MRFPINHIVFGPIKMYTHMKVFVVHIACDAHSVSVAALNSINKNNVLHIIRKTIHVLMP